MPLLTGHRRRTSGRVALCLSTMVLTPSVATVGAQQPMIAAHAVADSSLSPHVPWVTSREWRAAGMVAGSTALLVAIDRPLALHIARTVTTPSPLVDMAHDVSAVAQPAVVASAVALLAIGRVTQKPAIADVGLHATEALLVASAVTGATKRVIGRLRPYAVDARRPLAFEPRRQDDAARSFPSGHATLAFTLAAVLNEEALRHPRFATNRRTRWLIRSLLYGSATAIGGARLVEGDHWVSDLAAGAGVGILSARWTVRQRHARTANRFERWLTGASPEQTSAHSPT